MHFEDLKAIEAKINQLKNHAGELEQAEKHIAAYRQKPEYLMGKFLNLLVENSYYAEKKIAANELHKVIERLWPDMCREVELLTNAKTRTVKNHMRLLQNQLSAYCDHLPKNDPQILNAENTDK